MGDEIQKQIERIKQELTLYLIIAERLNFPKEEVERQVNLYLEDIAGLLKDKD